MERALLGFCLMLRTPPGTPATHVRPRPGPEHGPVTTPSIFVEPPINVFTHMRTTSRRKPCGRLSRPRTTTRTPPRPAPISRHRALPGCHQQPGAHGALPTFAMIRLTGSAAGFAPTAHPAGTRSLPPATTPGLDIRTWSEPPSNRAASLLSTTQIRQVSSRSRNRGVSTTSTFAVFGGWTGAGRRLGRGCRADGLSA